ncbi:hypothetical protein [Streptomyces sp. NPDC058665]|uniref:hypothetical protein n=1 Tax=Streptomyces sp. NPDC058665 TaxID=3346586 RepID=UPI00365C9EBD
MGRGRPLGRPVFGAGVSGSGHEISPHPHEVLDQELDRLTETGGLPASSRPGADFVLWAAIHGLATLLIDGLARVDDSPGAVAREAERVVRVVLDGLTREAVPDEGRPAVRSLHTEQRADE